MPFSRLATVELQLVMQCCDQRTLLRLARCSRFTHQAAQHKCAWCCLRSVVVSSALCADAEPSRSALRRVWQWLRRPFGQRAAAPPVSPLGVLRDSLLRHADADRLLRWTGNVDAADADGLRAALATLAALPRLRLLDLACRVFLRAGQSVADLQPAVAAGLTALNISAVHLRANHMATLARHLPQLRTLRCAPCGAALECLQPLTQLPQLADLGLVAAGMRSPLDEFAVIAECPNLRRLALCDILETQCGLLLLAPGLQRLQHLTLAQVFCLFDQPRADWAAAFSNLQSLRRLTIDRCKSTCAAPLLAAVAGAGCPPLRRLRVAPNILHRSNSWKAALKPRSFYSLDEGISALLERRPEVRVELRVGFGMAGVSASWLLPLRAECDWQLAVPQWTDFELLHPLRHKVRRQPLLFADSGLGCESPTDPDGIEQDLAD